MRKYIFYNSLISILIISGSCKKTTQDSGKIVSINQITSDYDSLIKNIVSKGDTNAYDELFYGFIDSNKTERTDSVLRYSRIMAETYRYDRAYFDYLKALCEKYEIQNDWSKLSELNLAGLNETSKHLALDWLNQMLKDKIITQEEFDSVKK
jgi:hypothetical protein